MQIDKLEFRPSITTENKKQLEGVKSNDGKQDTVNRTS